ncbi:hypothetical protein LTR37_011988 [Vermiconidia calcicola]|uniref:Uncharacterized protein n=1 Tax=Vermiconidia calcicola TaxID=1690605 RepID=A0ACC3N0I3_9PEZI|nr:hypothetical protein LTR37_011988 [Vermiconidia calcicola]
MALTCFCGDTFATVGQLHDHATTFGHRIQCSCGQLLGTDSQLKRHNRTVRHDHPPRSTRSKPLLGMPGPDNDVEKQQRHLRHGVGITRHINNGVATQAARPAAKKGKPLTCPFCAKHNFKTMGDRQQHIDAKHLEAYSALLVSNNAKTIGTPISTANPATPSAVYACSFCADKTFKHHEDLDQHLNAKHPFCPTCGKYFSVKYKQGLLRSAEEQRVAHQLGTKHCYCEVHNIAFCSFEAYEMHFREIDHDHEDHSGCMSKAEMEHCSSSAATAEVLSQDGSPGEGNVGDDSDVSDDDGGFTLG